ncbi:MAG: hypothetical protein GX344_07365, partial [Intrasporangiaceae bacterium]|nr:hypothetical protein [Intrasporangiaceae bacterium]
MEHVGPQPSATTAAVPDQPTFPDESTTGVPAGVTLSPSSGLTVTNDGAVIDGLDVSGRIIVAAGNVTIRNSRVSTDTDLYPIHIQSGTTGTLIEHVEVDNLGGTGLGIFFEGGGTVRHANVHSANDGIRIQANDVSV